MSSERKPYIRMDGTRRPSIFALDKAFTGKSKVTSDSSKAFAGVPLNLKGTPPLRRHNGAYSRAKGVVPAGDHHA